MKKQTKILIGIVAVALVIGVAVVLSKRGGGGGGKATPEQYAEFKKAAKKAKFNIFMGVSPESMEQRKIDWENNLTKEDAQSLIDYAKEAVGASNEVKGELLFQASLIIEKWTDSLV